MASNGVCVRAQMPPAMPNTARIRMRKVLRALASMSRSRSGGGAECCSVGVLVAFTFPLLLHSLTPVLHCALHLGLGINQEVGAGHNPVILLEAREQGVVVAILSTQLDKARLQHALAFIHEDQI